MLNADEARYSLRLGDYDRSEPLIIDPRLQSSYLGGSGDDLARALAIHPTSGEVYLAGYAPATSNLRGISGGARSSYGGGNDDAFISRWSFDLAARDLVPNAFGFAPRLNVPVSIVGSNFAVD